MEEIGQKLDKLQQQFSMASQVEAKDRDLYQRKIVELGERVMLFNRLQASSRCIFRRR